ncbi:nicotinate-nucleotide--dimethylbenzimidazole phosphoribosyltransferase [Leptospira sp. 96542]|nr:nicotinate-nucleotide--dimethylbenzimidazole phosphoribosyltransferase [Leptospira sp. 96542]
MSQFLPPEPKRLTNALRDSIQAKIDSKTKPVGSLGALETITFKIANIQNTLEPKLKNPTLLLFAADHGITEEPVSLYPKDVTWQMVENFLRGGACANVFARFNQINVEVIDAGVDHDWSETPTNFHSKKIRYGTKNFKIESAMTLEDANQCLTSGFDFAQSEKFSSSNVFLFGEMGIGNTSSASMILSQLTGIPLIDLVGRGTGLNEKQKENKLKILEDAYKRTGRITDPIKVLSEFGGFEIGMMAGAIIGAAAANKLIIIDGFIATAAYVLAQSISDNIRDYVLFSHLSDEKGHKKVLDFLKFQPILQLNLRLGEGSGALAAYPIIELALKFLNEMASFSEAGVSKEK